MDTNKKVGPIVGVLVIVLVIIIASLYFFSRKLNTENANATPTTESTVDAGTYTSTGTALEADSASVIQSDLDSQMMNIDSSF